LFELPGVRATVISVVAWFRARSEGIYRLFRLHPKMAFYYQILACLYQDKAFIIINIPALIF
jgi:hypothetical protein